VVKNEEDIIRPAVQGTYSVMRACHKYKVKRLVITSSVVAANLTKDPTKKHFTTNDWSDLAIANAYDKSKTIAERTAWDYLESLPENQRFELVTILPGIILGPNLVTAQF
jgi:nucleoside-diphosphate-sugar epimerase